MKQLIRWTLAMALTTCVAPFVPNACAQLFPGMSDVRSALTIKSDGTCLFTSEMSESRAAAEQQVRLMERYKNASEDSGEGDAGQRLDAKKAFEPKPLSDDELARQVRDMMENGFNAGAEDADTKTSVAVNKETVRIETTRTFASLEELLSEGGPGLWGANFSFENIRFEPATNNLLKVTLTPPSEIQRFRKSLRSRWKLSGTTNELKLVFPGKVVSSGFPQTEANTTWITIDPRKDETLDAAMKLYEGPTVIIAEAGGLALNQALDSRTLERRRGNRAEPGDELPIQDASPGFVAEAQSLTTTALKVFPGGGAYFKQIGRYSLGETGTVVSATLFAPKGRTLKSVSHVRVLKAVDDKGRSIPAKAGDEEAPANDFSGGDSEDPNSRQIQLHLQLPLPDAQAITEITAEAIAVTAGKWREMTLTNIQESATNELDLSNVLPGSKMVITKFTSRHNQFTIQARIEGPPAVKLLDIQAKTLGTDRFSSSLSERDFREKGKATTRAIFIQAYGFGGEESSVAAPLALRVRFPEDLRRERVNFKLNGLDLL